MDVPSLNACLVDRTQKDMKEIFKHFVCIPICVVMIVVWIRKGFVWTLRCLTCKGYKKEIVGLIRVCSKVDELGEVNPPRNKRPTVFPEYCMYG